MATDDPAEGYPLRGRNRLGSEYLIRLLPLGLSRALMTVTEVPAGRELSPVDTARDQ